MDNSYRYFMLVAEKLNMSDVARESFISHQCVSAYIRNLEDRLKVRLFNRKPSLSLTREGEVLMESLQRIRIIEDGLLAQLTEEENIGRKLRIGILSSRYSTLTELLVPRYKKLYPDVEIEIYGDFSNVLEAKAANGNIDLFIGHGRSTAHALTSVNLLSESYYLMINAAMLKKYFADSYPACVENFRTGVDLLDFKDAPFILHPHPSRLRKIIDEIAHEKRFEINVSLQMNATEIFPHLCRRGIGTCIVSQMFFPVVRELNEKSTEDEYIHVFPVNDLADIKGEMYLSFVKQKYAPSFQTNFIKMAREIFDEFRRETPKPCGR